MGQAAQRFAVPGDQKIERRLVDGDLGRAGLGQQEAFSALSFAIPFVLAGERPHGVSRRAWRSVLLHQPGRHLGAHLDSDGTGVFASQAKGFEEALAWRRHGEA